MTNGTPATYPDPDIRPLVRTAPAGNRSLLIFGVIVVIAALLLFEALDARREALTAPATQIAPASGAMVTAPPPLSLPPQFRATSPFAAPENLQSPLLPARTVVPAAPPQVVTRIVERPAPAAIAPAAPALLPQPAIIENRPPQETDLSVAAASATASRPVAANERILAGRLRNPRLTVPQGTVIAAVLETALDSSRPGGVRAIVQRDVMGFDGTRVLIPRGSRLYGEYGSDVSSGQKRAFIRWTRLTRPDAVIVNLDSPAADPLGRTGVEGKVDSHFFARFGGAILQSVLNLGVGVATASTLDHGAFVALPSTVGQVAPVVQPKEIAPTLRVKQGTSVSVFVARDLDFSSVDQ
jgi:type IV secretion system protein VirB10